MVEKLERAEKAVYFAKRTCNRGGTTVQLRRRSRSIRQRGSLSRALQKKKVYSLHKNYTIIEIPL